MLLNNKEYAHWDINDIQTILEDETFKENEYIDYKIDFAFLEAKDKNEQNKKKDEFRNDICSFANSNGGYLFFGIAESKGIPTKIMGVTIKNDNTDAFELSIRNTINQIVPMVPECKCSVIKVEEEKYVIVIRISKGFYKPYVSKNDDRYKFCIRRGNGKVAMTYEEVRMMFNQSMALSEQIEQFREKRIEMCKNKDGVASSVKAESFALVHLIPDFAFVNSSFFNPYDEVIKQDISFPFIFKNNSSGEMMPNVDGITYKGYDNDSYLQIFKSAALEKFIAIKARESTDNPEVMRIPIISIYEKIINIFEEAVRFYKALNITNTIYIAISVINCKGFCTDVNFYTDYVGFVDRNTVVCMPIAIKDIYNEKEIEKIKQSIIADFCRSLGRKSIDEK